MKVTIAQRKGNGDIVYTNIEPTISDHKGLPQHHTVRIERHENGSNSRTVSRFFLDTEAEAWDLVKEIAACSTSFIGMNPKIEARWKEYNLEELYA